ncbi:hypothetical protein PG987_015939 [Apiospora arundinis]
MDLQIFTKIEPVKETCIQSICMALSKGVQDAVTYSSSTQARHGSPSHSYPPAAPYAHSSDKKAKKNKGSKSSKSNKKKQNKALLGIGSQFDNDNDGAAGSGGSYPQDLDVD